MEIDTTSCDACKSDFLVGEEVGFLRNPDTDEITATLCKNCFRNISRVYNMHTALPTSGALKPILTQREFEENRANSFTAKFWVQFETDLLASLVQWEGKLMTFSLSSRTYSGYKVHFSWNGGRITSLSFPGNTKKVKPPINIYQIHRLRKLGLIGAEDNPREWSLALTPAEQQLENIARIVSHVLEFGFLIDPSRISGLTPIIDTKSED